MEPPRPSPPPAPGQFSLRGLLVGVSVIAVLMGLTTWAVRSSQEQKRLARRGRSFLQVGLGFDNHEACWESLPPASTTDRQGKPLCSWRVVLVPYLMSWPSLRYDKSRDWDSPENDQLAMSPFREFFCIDSRTSDRAGPSYTMTNMVAITGPGTAFEQGVKRRIEDLPDDLILVVETRNSGIHWMQPGDLDVRTMPRTINAKDGRGIAPTDGNVFFVLFADGMVWGLSTDVPFEAVETFFTIDSARQADRDQVLGPYVRWRSGRP